MRVSEPEGPHKTPIEVFERYRQTHNRGEKAQPAEGAVPHPWITLTWAQTLDGSIAAEQGRPTAISGSETQRFTHQLRSTHDSILVGIGTVLSDDPRLNVRHAEGPDPIPVILDPTLQTPPDARCLRTPDALIAVGEDVPASCQAPFRDRGVTVVVVPQERPGILDFRALVDHLALRGITSIMVEGGGAVIGHVLTSGTFDAVVVTVAPMFVGGYQPLRGPFTEGIRLAKSEWIPVGNDVVLVGIRDREWAR